jgi:aminoglycoside phosphotransferase (APT) family kinase protein
LTAALDGTPEAELALGRAAHRLLDAAHGPAGPADAPDGAAAEEPVPSPADVTAYLRARRPGSADEAHRVRAITGGFSKRTLLVTATLDGEQQQVVLRQVPAGRKARGLLLEFEVVRAAHAAGMPVPEPMWIEPEDNRLGGAFFVTRRAPGANIGDVWGADGVSKELCGQVAELYARLHNLDATDVPMPFSPRSTPEELREMIAYQERTLVKRGIEISPALAALFAWLRAHIPAPPPRASLLHGDAAFSNLLIDGGKVSAVLDWEAAHLGHPAEELAYLRPSVEPVLPWSDFLDRYVAAGGTTPDPEAMRFFEVWSHVWRHTGCLWLAQNFDATGRYASAVAGYVHGPRFLAAGITAAFGDA